MIGIGFIGSGMIGQIAHIANYVDLPGCRLIGLAELRQELGDEAARRFNIPRTYRSHRELLQDPDVQAVVVVTRRPATGPIVLDALNAGRHVLSEKPMAHTLEQAKRLVEAADRAGKVYAVGYMKRHDAGVQHARNLLRELERSGELGRIVLVRAHCYGGDFDASRHGFSMTAEARPEGLDLWPTAPSWLPASMAADYAWFLNVFVHDLNLIRFLTGRSPQVSSVDLSRPNGRLVTLDFGDFSGILEMAEVQLSEWDEGIEVLFEKGRLRLTLPPPLVRDRPAYVELYRRDETIIPKLAPSWAFRRQAEAFVTDIETRRSPLASGLDSIEDMALVEAIWRRHCDRLVAT